MKNLNLTQVPVAKAEMLIRKPLTDVTEALFDLSIRSKNFIFEERPSDSAFVETVWRTQMESPSPFIFPAVSHWGLFQSARGSLSPSLLQNEVGYRRGSSRTFSVTPFSNCTGAFLRIQLSRANRS